MALVFLSYTHKDKERADKVQRELQIRGHRVWRDVTELKAGSPIPDNVAKGISLCDYFIILVTENALQSEWMRGELNLYATNPKRWECILPLKYDKTKPSDFSPLLSPLNWIDFTSGLEQGIAKILETLGDPTEESDKKLRDLERMHFAIDMAVSAGNTAMRCYNSSVRQNEMTDERKNMATLADKAAQNEIIRKIKSHNMFENDGLIAEEHPFNNIPEVLHSEYTWVVDPLDGTANFDTRIPLFCTAIGLLRNDKPYRLMGLLV